MNEFVELDRLTLERFKIGVAEVVDCALLKEVANNLTVYNYLDTHTNTLIRNFRSMLWGKRLENLKYPASWWEHLKERWFPEVLKKWFPVQYAQIDVAAIISGIAIPKNAKFHVLTFSNLEGTPWKPEL